MITFIFARNYKKILKVFKLSGFLYEYEIILVIYSVAVLADTIFLTNASIDVSV
jgi:hypothetical protein